jgi:hypothetical protein
VQHEPEAPACGRELVHGRGGGWRQPALRDEARGLQLLQPVGEDVRADPWQAGDEVGVALRPLGQLADDEQRPALADEAEGAGDGAVLVVALQEIILQDDLRFASIDFVDTSLLCRKDSSWLHPLE